MTDQPDYQELKIILLESTRQAFTAVQDAHPDEKFYAFSLFHAPLWEYILPVSNTEEGLSRRVEEYISNPLFLNEVEKIFSRIYAGILGIGHILEWGLMISSLFMGGLYGMMLSSIPLIIARIKLSGMNGIIA